jgi:YjbE family integral membrane protein
MRGSIWCCWYTTDSGFSRGRCRAEPIVWALERRVARRGRGHHLLQDSSPEKAPLLIDQAIALAQVIIIDLALAADNAIVIGMAAAGLPKPQRRQAIAIGIIGATVLRIVFAIFTTQLLQIVGLLVAGGILLLWVAWKMWRDIRAGAEEEAAPRILEDAEANGDDAGTPATARFTGPKTLREAAIRIIVADVSMSLDNVLAVAGAAREHVWVLVFGLSISIVLMGFAANWVASLVQRHRWIAWLGLLTVLYIALAMIWEGSVQVYEAVEASAA